jgi:hypothetical protein
MKNSWSPVKILICLEMWSEESSEWELDIINSSIYGGSSKVFEGFVSASYNSFI